MVFISVLIPCSSTKYLLSTLISINLAHYDLKYIQLVLVLNGTELDPITSEYISKHFLHSVILNQEIPGIVPTLNRGLQACEHEFIARLDSDDLTDRNRFKRQVNYLRRNPRCVAVGGQSILISEQGQVIGHGRYPRGQRRILSTITSSNPLAHPAVMYRKSAVLKVGSYRENLPEDWDLWLRLSQEGELGNLKEFVLFYRIHNQQISRTEIYSNLEVRNRMLRETTNIIHGQRQITEDPESSTKFINLLFKLLSVRENYFEMSDRISVKIENFVYFLTGVRSRSFLREIERETIKCKKS